MARIAPPWTKNAFRQPGVRCGRDQAGVEGAQSFEPAEPLEEVLERIDAVAEPCRFFVAEAFGQVGEAFAAGGAAARRASSCSSSSGVAPVSARAASAACRRLPIGPSSVAVLVTTNSSPRRRR